MRRLVLVGGGHAHLFVLEALGAAPEPGLAVTLVSPAALSLYSGMAPGVIAGTYAQRAAQIDVARLARRAGAAFVAARVVAIDAAARQLYTDAGDPLDYDQASFDVGAATALEIPVDAGATVVPVKPLEGTLIALCAPLAGAVAILGAGAAGVELAFALAASRSAVTLLGLAPTPLPSFHPRVRRLAVRALAAAGVTWRGNASATEVARDGVRLRDGGHVAAALVVAASGVGRQTLFAAAGLPTDALGALTVGDDLRCIGHPELFAAGDCAALVGHPRLARSGVHAVRQGPLLVRNLGAAFRGAALAPYRPRPHSLALLSTADGRAILAYGGLTAHNAAAWRLKDWIDRRFIARFDR